MPAIVLHSQLERFSDASHWIFPIHCRDFLKLYYDPPQSSLCRRYELQPIPNYLHGPGLKLVKHTQVPSLCWPFFFARTMVHSILPHSICPVQCLWCEAGTGWETYHTCTLYKEREVTVQCLLVCKNVCGKSRVWNAINDQYSLHTHRVYGDGKWRVLIVNCIPSTSLALHDTLNTLSLSNRAWDKRAWH